MAKTKEITNVEKNAVPDEFLIPPVMIYETQDGYTMELDMAGASKDSIDISIENEILKVKGNIKLDIPENAKISLEEFEPLTYYREFRIGKGIDTSKVEGKFENGVLKVILSKKEELKPKKIQITAE